MTPEKRTIVVIAAVIALPVLYVRLIVPAVGPLIVFAIWAKDGFCDVGCPDENLNWLFTGLNVAAVGAYALTVIIGARWVMRGLREQRHGED